MSIRVVRFEFKLNKNVLDFLANVHNVQVQAAMKLGSKIVKDICLGAKALLTWLGIFRIVTYINKVK